MAAAAASSSSLPSSATPEQAYSAFKAAAREFVGGSLPADRFRALFLRLFGGGGGGDDEGDDALEALFLEMALLVPSAPRRLELLRLAPRPFDPPLIVPTGDEEQEQHKQQQTAPPPPRHFEAEEEEGEDEEDDDDVGGAGYYGNEDYDEEEYEDEDEDEDEDEVEEQGGRRRKASGKPPSPSSSKSDLREMTGWQVLDRSEIRKMAAQMDAPRPRAGAGMGRAARAAASEAVRASAEAAVAALLSDKGTAAPGRRAGKAGRSGSESASAAVADDPRHRPNVLLWLRGHDLRLHDNPALLDACKRAAGAGGGVAVAFVRDDHLCCWSDANTASSSAAWRPGSAARAWQEAGLRALDASLRRRYGGALGVVFLRAEEGEAAASSTAAALRRLADAVGASCVVYNGRSEPREREADVAVVALLEEEHEQEGSEAAHSPPPPLDVRCVSGAQLLRDPDSVTMDAQTWQGGHWGTFTPFLKAWEKAGRIPDAAKAPANVPAVPFAAVAAPGGSLLDAAVREAERLVAKCQEQEQQQEDGDGEGDGSSIKRTAAAKRRLAAALAVRDAAAGGVEHLGLVDRQQQRAAVPRALGGQGEGVGKWAERMLREGWGGGAEASGTSPPPASEEAALLALDRFLDPSSSGGLRRYDAERGRADKPDSVSRLSPYLRGGQLSARVVHQRLRQANAQALSRAFGRRLAWRELAHWQLRRWPDLAVRGVRAGYWDDDDEGGGGNGNNATATTPVVVRAWRPPGAESSRLLELWQRGQTGYPLVDAGMRQLWQTGWMPQGARMVCAAWLVHAARLPWHEGARWFHDTLVDADAAINAMMWSNCAGAGLDQWDFDLDPAGAAGKACDPQGVYVARWCPELAGLLRVGEGGGEGGAAAAAGDSGARSSAQAAAAAQLASYVRAPWRAPAEVLAAAGVELGVTYPLRALLSAPPLAAAAGSPPPPLPKDGEYAAARAEGTRVLGMARAARARVVAIGEAGAGGGSGGGKKGGGGGGGSKKGSKKKAAAAAAPSSSAPEALLDARGYDVIATPPGSTPKAAGDGVKVALFTTEANRKAALEGWAAASRAEEGAGAEKAAAAAP
jgi:deoxyribodipyrimidine photolyase